MTPTRGTGPGRGRASARTRGPAATSGRSAAARSASRRPSSRGPRATTSGKPSQIRRSTPRPSRATAAAAARSRSRPGGITGRAITLGALVISLVLLLVYPVTHYVQQQSEIEAIDQQIADTKTSISELESKLELLDDDAYLKAQARARLNYITPGDKVYVVADNGPDSETTKKAEAAKKAQEAKNSSALGDLAESIAKADSGS